MVLLLLVALALHVPAQIGASDGRVFRVRPPLAPVGAASYGEARRSPGEGGQAQGSPRLREETFQSAALGKPVKYRVLLPQDYDTSERRYPVLYLLHGLGGDYRDWTVRTNLADYSRAYPLIVVMPDGGNQWYMNAADGSARAEDALFSDLPADVVQKFRTINSRYGRAVAGLSMGGYGAMRMALKRPGAFAVAASFSGALNITRAGELEKLMGAAEAARIATIFGPAGGKTRVENNVFALAAALKPPAAPYIYLDCGTADNALIDASRELAATLHKAGVAYEYHEIAGGHSWDYWDRRIREFLPILMRKLEND